MFKSLKFILVVSSLLLVAGCDDNSLNSLENLQGTYEGTFTVEYNDGKTYSNDVTVNFGNNNSYNSTGNGNNNDFYPSGGRGYFSIENKIIHFSDTNIWLAHFDSNLILRGSYEYSAEEDKLILQKELNEFGTYRYQLEKREN